MTIESDKRKLKRFQKISRETSISYSFVKKLFFLDPKLIENKISANLDFRIRQSIISIASLKMIAAIIKHFLFNRFLKITDDFTFVLISYCDCFGDLFSMDLRIYQSINQLNQEKCTLESCYKVIFVGH